MVGPVKPDKRLGQHFLHDQRAIARIADAIGVAPGEVVAEIGPGTGALTKALLERGAKVVALEMDERCWPLLEAMDGVTLVRGDALEFGAWLHLLPQGGKVVGNLPYNVGSEMVARLCELGRRVGPMTFMLQKEVVGRICARPGGGEWGRLGVVCQMACDARRLFDVAPGAFTPPPKVMSSVVEMVPLPAPRFAVDRDKLDRLLRAAFGQRRKMLRASLRGMVAEDAIAAAGIAPTKRPEELSLEELCRLAGAL